MAHPHRAKAAETSREKFKSITGRMGGGNAYAGGSHQRPNEHGELRMRGGNHKLADERAHGGRSHRRGDRYARGGAVADESLERKEAKGGNKPVKRNAFPSRGSKVSAGYADGGRAKKGKGPENVTINITAAQPDTKMPAPPMMPPTPPPGSPPPGGAPPSAPPAGGGMPGAGAPGGGGNPLQALAGKGMGGFARGGRASHKQTGDSNYDMSHWREYAGRDKTKKIEMLASGGGIRMKAGAMSGVGRLEQANYQKRRGRGR